MIFRQPSNGGSKIGRKIEFSNPLRFSNKKHFWCGGVGNYGILTTEQIQILNQMKQREKKAHLNDTKRVENGLNYSIKEVKYGQSVQQNNKNDHYRSFDVQKHNHRRVDKEKRPIRDTKPQRSASEFKLYNQGQPSYEKFITIDNQQIPNSHPHFNKGKALRRIPNNQRRVKTVGIEEMRDLTNPQDNNRIDQIFSGLINTDQLKRQKTHLRMQSGNIRVSHSPQTLKNISKSIDNPISSLQTQSYSDRSQNPTRIQPISNIQNSNKNMLQGSENIESKMMRLEGKRLTRHKFKRDHSPTFCNSIEYPLKYYRHI